MALIQDCLGKTGMPPDDAAKVAVLMTEADLTGADAHGVFRLPQYVRRLSKGGVNPRPNIRVEKTALATAIVDGDKAYSCSKRDQDAWTCSPAPDTGNDDYWWREDSSTWRLPRRTPLHALRVGPVSPPP